MPEDYGGLAFSPTGSVEMVEERESVRRAVATPGVITKIDDPERLGRVQVSLPTLGDVETDWMESLSAGGGDGKGLLMIPDLGDRVLVLDARGEPAQGIALGGIFGPRALPDDELLDKYFNK